jgi:PhnB protein
MVVSDTVAAVEFLRAVFGALGEVPADRPAEMRIGDSLIMVSSAGEREAFPAFLYVYVDIHVDIHVDTADAAYHRAIAAGATSIERPLDTPYGDRRAMVRDPFGNVFQIAHRIPARS